MNAEPAASRDNPSPRRETDLRSLPPAIDIETAASLLGIGRTLAYTLAKQDRFPCRVLRHRQALPRTHGGPHRVLGADTGC